MQLRSKSVERVVDIKEVPVGDEARLPCGCRVRVLEIELVKTSFYPDVHLGHARVEYLTRCQLHQTSYEPSVSILSFQRVYADIEGKRKAARYLHLAPQLVGAGHVGPQ